MIKVYKNWKLKFEYPKFSIKNIRECERLVIHLLLVLEHIKVPFNEWEPKFVTDSPILRFGREQWYNLSGF